MLNSDWLVNRTSGAAFTWDEDNGSTVTCDDGGGAHVTREGLAQTATFTQARG